MHPSPRYKEESALMVKKMGVPVPNIYSFREAKERVEGGERIIPRVMLLQDYNGASGLIDGPSPSIICNVKSEAELRKAVREREEKKMKNERSANICYHNTVSIFDYFAIFNMPQSEQEKFWGNLSFSYWQEKGGFNMSITADSAIRGRLHVTIDSGNFNAVLMSKLTGYAIIEDGKLREEFGVVPESLHGQARAIDDFYRKVTSFWFFPKGNCATLEVELSDGELFFLQYLRGLQFEAAKFVLDRQPQPEEIVADFVRGATAPFGGYYLFKLYDRAKFPRLGDWNEKFPEKVDGAFDISQNAMLRELSMRYRQANLLFDSHGADAFLGQAHKHSQISALFKPKITGIFNIDDIDLKKMLCKKKNTNFLEDGSELLFPAWITSDGNKLYLKVL